MNIQAQHNVDEFLWVLERQKLYYRIPYSTPYFATPPFRLTNFSVTGGRVVPTTRYSNYYYVDAIGDNFRLGFSARTEMWSISRRKPPPSITVTIMLYPWILPPYLPIYPLEFLIQIPYESFLDVLLFFDPTNNNIVHVSLKPTPRVGHIMLTRHHATHSPILRLVPTTAPPSHLKNDCIAIKFQDARLRQSTLPCCCKLQNV